MSSLRLRSFAVLLALVPCVGCSFVAVQGPPSEHFTLDEFDCTSGNGIPVVDGLLTVGIPGGILLAFADEGMSGGAVAATAGAAVPFAAGALYGLFTTASCRDARSQLYARRAAAARREEAQAAAVRAEEARAAAERARAPASTPPAPPVTGPRPSPPSAPPPSPPADPWTP